MAVRASLRAASLLMGPKGPKRCASDGDLGRHGCTPSDREPLRERAGTEEVTLLSSTAHDRQTGQPAVLSKCAPSEAEVDSILESALVFKEPSPFVSKVGKVKKQTREEQTVPLGECQSMIERITAKMQKKLDVLEEAVEDSRKFQHAAEEELASARRIFNNESAELNMQVEVLTAVKVQLSGQIKDLHQRCSVLEENFEQCCGKDICVICMEAPSNAVFTDCGHMVCCERCAASLPQCPMCREKVQNWQKIYRS